MNSIERKCGNRVIVTLPESIFKELNVEKGYCHFRGRRRVHKIKEST